jgi:hypothetical protein
MKTTGTLVAGLLGLGAAPLAAQTETAALEPLGFLIGRWETMSVTARGDSAPGALEYQWVLGGDWIKVTFDGRPPDGRLWEAHVMITHEASTNAWISYAFYDAASPHRSQGTVLDDGTVRFRSERDGRVTGIDYRDNGDGTVYQENWALGSDQERVVTLRTTYQPAPDPTDE